MSYNGVNGSNRGTYSRGLVHVYVSFFRTGGPLTVPDDGNITNVTVGRLALPPVDDQPLASGRSGRLAHFVAAPGTGLVELTAVAPGAGIPTGSSFSFGGTFLSA
jgi:hypothetical protein